jgi:hypothetical protein
MYHAILIDKEFVDNNLPNQYPVFAKKIDGSWIIYGVEIQNDKLEKTVALLQKNLKDDISWYFHIYNDKELIVVFKNKVFRVKPHKSTWNKIVRYGKEQGIPAHQLDFWPNRFQDEIHYFSKT